MKLYFNSFKYSAIVLFVAMIISSCGDIVQDLHIHKDGSGSLETTIDMGELMGMGKNFEDMGAAQDTFTDDTIREPIISPEAPEKDAMSLLMETITDPEHDRDFDTTMSLLSLMPDSLREKETRLDLANKVSIRLTSPAKSADLKLGVQMKFNDSKDLRELIDYMESLNETPVSMGQGMMMSNESFLVFDTDMKAGWIRIDTILYTGFSAQMGMSLDSSMTTEDLGLMEMMFGNSKIKSLIHVPGEVISCTNQDAILTKDNKVIVEYPMMDVIKKGRIDGFTIYFKP